MADNFLVQQPNGQWATMRSVDVGDGVQVPLLRAAAGPAYIAGTYPLSLVHGSAAAVPAADVGYALPFRVREVVTPASFGVRTQTGGVGSSFKIGVWANNPATMRPTGLPLTATNTGEGTASNNTTDLNAVPAYEFIPGVDYWVISKFTGTLPSIVMCGNTWLYTAILTGAGLGSAGSAVVTGYSTPLAYADNMTTTDLTSAVWTAVLSNTTPNYVMGVS